jgi:hypothetical protein
MKVSPGVIVKSKFATSKSKGFKGYIRYIGREKALSIERESSFADYQNYMGNEEKTTGIFTKSIDRADPDQVDEIAQVYKDAQKKGSILWQDVISFDNDFLQKYGIYDPEKKQLDEKKMRDITRSSMDKMLGKENMKETAFWTAAIHYNTDNIHIHVATIEPIPTRERGKRKLKSLEAMKSNVVNKIMDRSKDREELDRLTRESIIGGKKQVALSMDNKTKKLFQEVMKELPENKRHWQYNYNKIEHLRPKIDEISRRYIEKYRKSEFAQLNKKLDEESTYLRDAWGSNEKSRYEGYKDNKLDDLYTRLGNATLTEMKQYAYAMDKNRFKQAANSRNSLRNNRNINHSNLNLMFALKQVNRHMDRSYDRWKNQMEYERLYGLNNENEYEREEQ